MNSSVVVVKLSHEYWVSGHVTAMRIVSFQPLSFDDFLAVFSI